MERLRVVTAGRPGDSRFVTARRRERFRGWNYLRGRVYMPGSLRHEVRDRPPADPSTAWRGLVAVGLSEHRWVGTAHRGQRRRNRDYLRGGIYVQGRVRHWLAPAQLPSAHPAFGRLTVVAG